MEMEEESISMDVVTRQPSVPTPCFHQLGEKIVEFFTKNKIQFQQDGDIFRIFFSSILDQLCKDTVQSPELRLYFLTNGVITSGNHEIWEGEVATCKRNYLMYEVVMQTKHIFHCIEALKRTSNGSIIQFIAAEIERFFQCSLLRPTRASGPCTLCLADQHQPHSSSSASKSVPPAATCELASAQTTTCIDERLPPNSSTTTVSLQTHHIRSRSSQENIVLDITSAGPSDEEPFLTIANCQPDAALIKPMRFTKPTHIDDLESGFVTAGFRIIDKSSLCRKLLELAWYYRFKICCIVVLVGVGYFTYEVFKTNSDNEDTSFKSPSDNEDLFKLSDFEEILMLHTSVKSVASISNAVAIEIPKSKLPAASDSIEARPARNLDVQNKAPTKLTKYIFDIDNPAKNPLLIPASRNDVTVILQPIQVYNWKSSWNTRNNTKKVTSLTLKGKFNLQDVVYFLRIFENLKILEISNENLLCDCLDELDFENDRLFSFFSEITHLIISDIGQSCNNLYRIFTQETVAIPYLENLTFENVSIQHENVVHIERLFHTYANSIKSLSLNIKLCTNCILFKFSMFPRLKNGSLNVNPKYSRPAGKTLECLSEAAPNMVTFSSNIQCIQEGQNILSKNWFHRPSYPYYCGPM